MSPSASNSLLKRAPVGFEIQADEREHNGRRPGEHVRPHVMGELVHLHLWDFLRGWNFSAFFQLTNGQGSGASASAAIAPKCSIWNRSFR